MNDGLKQRLVGAFVLFAMAVIFLPGILREQQPEPVDTDTHIPESPTMETVSFDEPERPAAIEPAPEPETMFAPDDSTQPVASNLDEAQEHAANVNDAAEAERTGTERSEQTSDASGAWVVQVASFASGQAATDLRDRLQSDGHKAYIRAARVNGRDVTRVYVGPKLNRDEANRIKAHVDGELQVESLVLRFQP